MDFDINKVDINGNSCLHHASAKGDIETIKFLLHQGADVWKKNKENFLPIDLSLNFETKKLLSEATLFYGDQFAKKVNMNIVDTPKLSFEL